jgi:Zn-dependent peptidase ImmA (M78 family)
MDKSADHPAMANRTDTLGHAVLNISLNRSPESMTAVAKRYGITKQAISKKVTEVYDRLGIRARSQKSEKARESYRKRAYRVHAKRRREAPKFNMAALKKGIKK